MKVGNYYVPDISLSDCIEIARIIYNEKISSQQSLATKLGHSTTNSGGFLMKLATLRQLDIIKSGIRNIELTHLGQKIAKPLTEEEKQSAYKEMLSHVILFIELKKRFATKNPDKNSILIALMDFTGLQRSDIDKEVSKIQKLYNDAEKFISRTSDSLMSDVGGISMDLQTNETTSQVLELKIGNLYMRIPKEIEAIEQAEIFLNAQKQALQKKKK